MIDQQERPDHLMMNKESDINSEKLTLHPGGTLIQTRWIYDDEMGRGEFVDLDVTQHASGHLFEIIQMTPDVILRDAFTLVKRNSFLRELLHHHWIGELFDEVSNAPQELMGPELQDIEYLELYWLWDVDTKIHTFDGLQRPNFHGVGIVRSEDLMENGYVSCKKGERIQWGICLSELSALLNLPLRIKKEVLVCESNLDNLNSGYELPMKAICETTLGQMLEGIFWELSFYGAPQDRRSFGKSLKERLEFVCSSIGNPEETEYRSSFQCL